MERVAPHKLTNAQPVFGVHYRRVVHRTAQPSSMICQLTSREHLLSNRGLHDWGCNEGQQPRTCNAPQSLLGKFRHCTATVSLTIVTASCTMHIVPPLSNLLEGLSRSGEPMSSAACPAAAAHGMLVQSATNTTQGASCNVTHKSKMTSPSSTVTTIVN